MAALRYVDREKPHTFEHLADEPAAVKAAPGGAAGKTAAANRTDGSQ